MNGIPHSENNTPKLSAAGLKAFFKVSDLWKLETEQCLRLLGRPSQATYYNWRKNPPQRLPHDTLTRIGYILGIYKALQILFSDTRRADAWIKKPNTYFGGQSALDRMLAGEVTDLASVRQYLDNVRGGVN